ncbi:hypothetical protein [Nocardia wallacei]|uniref:hypothetical protein n=1 Tax=Nocardia wallacei TaxID=480035 RepID=UPI002458C01A|nr:hypothetical protein [Nocardia wallacei]
MTEHRDPEQAADDRYSFPTMELPMVDHRVPGVLACHTDPGPLSPEQAHRIMQRHLDCGVDICRMRRRARHTLVEARRMVLDQRAEP